MSKRFMYEALVANVSVAILVHAPSARAQDITEFKNGYLTFTNDNTALYYRVEFRPNLSGSEVWDGTFRGLINIQSDDPEVTVPVGLFYRVVGRETPWVAGTASANDILSGKTAYVNDEEMTGAMTNIGQTNIMPGTVAQAIPQGYHDGSGEVAGDGDLVAVNIKKDVTVFGVTGNVVEATGTAEAGQVLGGITFSKAGEAGLAGTMPNQGGRGFLPGAAEVTIPAGYYDGSGVVTGDESLVTGNIHAGVTLFGVEGKQEVVDTSSGDAAAGDILSGSKAWVDGQEVTGTRPFAPVPQTGQMTACFTGDDGDTRGGVVWPKPRFTTNLNVTVVRDNLTGLEWLRNANVAGALDWTNALLYCNSMVVTSVWAESTVTNSDWRLPNRRELLSLVDDGRSDPALPVDHPFTDVQSWSYWSSTTLADSPDFAWHVNLYHGDVTHASKTNAYHLWPVRGGLPYPVGGDATAVSWEVINERWVRNYYADGAITMSDRDAGLIWVFDAAANGAANWDNAISHCNNLTYAGHSDWFLPNRDQLTDIYSQKNLFADVVSARYWSSTPSGDFYAYFKYMETGYMNSALKTKVYWIWPCRSQ